MEACGVPIVQGVTVPGLEQPSNVCGIIRADRRSYEKESDDHRIRK